MQRNAVSTESVLQRVVGIGASAGGLEALQTFFDSMPVPSGMAFVVVQHLSPDFKSLMDELLVRHTKMRVLLAENEMAIEPDTVYLNPPRQDMIISQGRLLLSDKDPRDKLTLPIDTFFRSLASDQGEKGVAIILSGTGSDSADAHGPAHEDAYRAYPALLFYFSIILSSYFIAFFNFLFVF